MTKATRRFRDGLPYYFQLNNVFFFIFLKLIVVALSAVSYVREILVHIKSVVSGDLNDATCNVRAMVGNSLVVIKKIRENEAVLNGALALLESQDMIELDLIADLVYNLLERLDVCRLGEIVMHKRIRSKTEKGPL